MPIFNPQCCVNFEGEIENAIYRALNITLYGFGDAIIPGIVFVVGMSPSTGNSMRYLCNIPTKNVNKAARPKLMPGQLRCPCPKVIIRSVLKSLLFSSRNRSG